MSEESPQDRTEAPTPRRRQDALKKGQVPRSQEVTTAFLFLASAGVVSAGTPAVAAYLTDTFGRTAASLTALPEGIEGMTGYLSGLGWAFLGALVPFLLPLTLTALAASAVQARGVFTFGPLGLKWERLDPVKKATQLWGWQAVAELVKSLVRLGIVAVAVYVSLGNAIRDVPALSQQTPYGLADLIGRYAARMFLGAGLAYLALALADYGYQVWQNERQLKMSREEIKKEVKESEGDQVVKVRRRTMARQMARRRMLLAVPNADVVVTNPTHIAVALRYDPAVADAPVVLAMGERKVAERIKELAREAGVPLVENKPLARALLVSARVGVPIPLDLFLAVAEVLAWVYRTQGSAPSRRRPGKVEVRA